MKLLVIALFSEISFPEVDGDVLNYLTYESRVSEILDTADSSDLSGECTRLYADEAEKKTMGMMGQISDALGASVCSDIVTSVTHTQSLTSLGNKVRK